MSGHNKYSQIKDRKGAQDKKRSLVFSKYLKAIAIAARADANPTTNFKLRSAIERAKINKVPLENVERALSRASEDETLEEVTIEAYGPESTAMIIEGITDNSNRTVSEVRNILTKNDAKVADAGSVLWAFSAEGGSSSGGETKWKAKFPQAISEAAKQKLQSLVTALEAHEDIQRVITNAE